MGVHKMRRGASPLNDGAAAVVLTARGYAETRDLEVLAVLGAPAQTAAPDTLAGGYIGQRHHQSAQDGYWTVEELDFVEINEAFASVAVHSGLGVERMTVNGGVNAFGHPLVLRERG